MAKRNEDPLNMPQREVLRSKESRNLFLAGQGAGKSHAIGVLTALFITRCPKSIGFIAANTYQQLSDATLFRVFQVWKDLFGWTEWTRNNRSGMYVLNKQPPASFHSFGHTFESNRHKIFMRNGAVIMTASLDNHDAIDGREFAWAALDETKDTKEVAVKDVILGRLREPGLYLYDAPEWEFPYTNDAEDGYKEQNPLYIFTSPSKEQWLSEYYALEDQRKMIEAGLHDKYSYYCEKIGHRRVVICSTYHNAHNLPSGYIEDRIAEFTQDRIDMLIYGSPFGKSGNEYYAKFSRSVHVVDRIEVDEDLPIHISFDFNVNPYMSCQVWQIQEGEVTEARCIKEYAFENPKNTVEDICRQIDIDYGHIMSRSGLFFYGDSSGKNSLPLKQVKDFYSIIEGELFKYLHNHSRRLLRQNPRHRKVGHGLPGRRDFMNAVLGGVYNVRIIYDSRCKYSIIDMEVVKEDKNGAKHKEKTKINGIRCEKYGHMSDATDAIICYLFGDYKRDKSK